MWRNSRKTKENRRRGLGDSLDLSRITYWYPILMKYCPNHPLSQSLRRERENMKKREDLADFFWDWD